MRTIAPPCSPQLTSSPNSAPVPPAVALRLASTAAGETDSTASGWALARRRKRWLSLGNATLALPTATAFVFCPPPLLLLERLHRDTQPVALALDAEVAKRRAGLPIDQLFPRPAMLAGVVLFPTHLGKHGTVNSWIGFIYV